MISGWNIILYVGGRPHIETIKAILCFTTIWYVLAIILNILFSRVYNKKFPLKFFLN